ncbi:MAG: hypothetical protein ABIR06_08410 [Cyclobacteriaceae bacterium]
MIKIKYYSVLCLFFLFTVLLFIFSSCQKELDEITPPPSDKVIVPNSAVSNYIQHIALHDGSPDNILDNASCISLVLPLTVMVNEQEIKIESSDDFIEVENILDEFENDNDSLRIIFPVTVTLADHTERIINNSDELEDIGDECTEGGSDDDIECVDFQYPLTFTVYDSQNQLSSVTVINNDEELFTFFDTMEEGDLASFKFPVLVILGGGEEITIDNNDQLEAVIESSIDECDEDDDNDHDEDDADDTGFITALLNSNWQITYFFDGSDETGAFADFVFIFHEDGATLSTNGVSSIQGTWDTNGDNGSINIKLNLGEEAPLDAIMEDWEVVEFNSSLIKLQDVSEEDQTVTTLVFERK